MLVGSASPSEAEMVARCGRLNEAQENLAPGHPGVANGILFGAFYSPRGIGFRGSERWTSGIAM